MSRAGSDVPWGEVLRTLRICILAHPEGSISGGTLSFWETCCQDPPSLAGRAAAPAASWVAPHPCLCFVTKGSLKVLPFHECLQSPCYCPSCCLGGRGLPRAMPGPSGVLPAGCANGRCTHGSTHNTWPWFLSSPSLFPFLSSWHLAEN